MDWTSDGIHITRYHFLGPVAGSGRGDSAANPDGVLREVLLKVLRQFPEAHAAVLKALEERVEDSGAR